MEYTLQEETQPVIVFMDGWSVIPNVGMRRALNEFFGPDSDDWIGQRLVIFRHRVQVKDPATGKVDTRNACGDHSTK